MGVYAAIIIKPIYTFIVQPSDTLTLSVLKAIIVVYVLGCFVLIIRVIEKMLVFENKKCSWNIKCWWVAFTLSAFYFLFMIPIFLARIGYCYFNR